MNNVKVADTDHKKYAIPDLQCPMCGMVVECRTYNINFCSNQETYNYKYICISRFTIDELKSMEGHVDKNGDEG